MNSWSSASNFQKFFFVTITTFSQSSSEQFAKQNTISIVRSQICSIIIYYILYELDVLVVLSKIGTVPKFFYSVKINATGRDSKEYQAYFKTFYTKCQTKSKLFFQVDVSSKKRTNEFYFTNMKPQVDLFFFRFFGRN